MAKRDPGKEIVEIAEGDDGEERDINRVVEDQGGARHQPGEVTEPAEGEVLAAAGERISRRELRIAEADQREHDSGRQEGKRREAQGGERDDAQGGVDVGTDGRIAPHVGAPNRNVPPKLAP